MGNLNNVSGLYEGEYPSCNTIVLQNVTLLETPANI